MKLTIIEVSNNLEIYETQTGNFYEVNLIHD